MASGLIVHSESGDRLRLLLSMHCDSGVNGLRSHACMRRAQVAGDGQELGALEAWYAREGGRTAESPLLIGSVKSNMGHCEGCSGLAGLAAFHWL